MQINKNRVDIRLNQDSNFNGVCVKVVTESSQLGYIDIQAGGIAHRPTFNSSKSLECPTLVCLGHLYVYSALTFELQESLKLLAKIYMHSGIDGINSAIGGGIFILLIIDHKKRQIFAITDELACMPLFYRTISAAFWIGTNQFDLSMGETPDRLACAEYLACGYLPFHDSLFTNVKRTAPGQILVVDVDKPEKACVTAEKLPYFPKVENRFRNEVDACKVLDKYFRHFFDRLSDEPIASGLSGGYDSRLIAAYSLNKNPVLVTFDNPMTRESEIAHEVAKNLGTKTEVLTIAVDSPSRFVNDFKYGVSTQDSLESSHVLSYLDMLMQNNPRYILDGFLGDVVLGSHYYYKLLGGLEPINRVLFAKDTYTQTPKNTTVYANRLLSLQGRRSSRIPMDNKNELACYMYDKLNMMADQQRDYCHTDADMLELMVFRIRSRKLISGGPVAFLRKAPVLCPFYDRDVFATCRSIAKSLRAGDRVYNAYWRYRFPELAGIVKEDTGGKPEQSPVAYRLTHLISSARRRANTFLPVKSGKKIVPGGDLKAYHRKFLHHPTNISFFERSFKKASPIFDQLRIKETAIEAIKENNATMYLRVVSLSVLLTNK